MSYRDYLVNFAFLGADGLEHRDALTVKARTMHQALEKAADQVASSAGYFLSFKVESFEIHAISDRGAVKASWIGSR